MGFLRNLLAVVGFFALAATIFGGVAASRSFSGFDPQAFATYRDMFVKLAETGDPAAATVWKAKGQDGLSFEDVDAAIKSSADSLNVKNVGELPLGDQVAAMRGGKWRKLKIYLYCNPLTAAEMIDYSEAYSAYLPCRVALAEDAQGALWLYSLNMDMMIHGGRPLPASLAAEAEKMKVIIKSILERGATGDF